MSANYECVKCGATGWSKCIHQRSFFMDEERVAMLEHEIFPNSVRVANCVEPDWSPNEPSYGNVSYAEVIFITRDFNPRPSDTDQTKLHEPEAGSSHQQAFAEHMASVFEEIFAPKDPEKQFWTRTHLCQALCDHIWEPTSVCLFGCCIPSEIRKVLYPRVGERIEIPNQFAGHNARFNGKIGTVHSRRLGEIVVYKIEGEDPYCLRKIKIDDPTLKEIREMIEDRKREDEYLANKASEYYGEEPDRCICCHEYLWPGQPTVWKLADTDPGDPENGPDPDIDWHLCHEDCRSLLLQELVVTLNLRSQQLKEISKTKKRKYPVKPGSYAEFHQNPNRPGANL